MERYSWKPKEVPLYGGYDVIVVGGGPAGIAASVSVSTADRESSKIRMSLSRTRTRAMAILCFCPPESVTPLSPTSVS